MSEIWLAAIGTVVSTGIGVAANAAMAPGFGGAAPVKFNPINIGKLNDQTIDFNKIGYDMADADLAKRLPGLVTGRDTLIDQTAANLRDPLRPDVQNFFTRNAIEEGLGATGGGNATAGIGPIGSASGNAAATSIGRQVQDKQDVDRSNLLSTIVDYPERKFGLSGSDAVNLAVGNAQNENAYNISKYQYDTQKAAAGGGF